MPSEQYEALSKAKRGPIDKARKEIAKRENERT